MYVPHIWVFESYAVRLWLTHKPRLIKGLINRLRMARLETLV